jgi:hypothetical protein
MKKELQLPEEIRGMWLIEIFKCNNSIRFFVINVPSQQLQR